MSDQDLSQTKGKNCPHVTGQFSNLHVVADIARMSASKNKHRRNMFYVYSTIY